MEVLIESSPCGCPTGISGEPSGWNGHLKEQLWWILMSHYSPMSHQPPPFKVLNDKSPFCGFCGWSDSYGFFFEGTSLTCHGIGVTKIQDQIYINANFWKDFPYVHLELGSTLGSLPPQKRSFSHQGFHIKRSYEVWPFPATWSHKKNNPIMARYVHFFFIQSHQSSQIQSGTKARFECENKKTLPTKGPW